MMKRRRRPEYASADPDSSYEIWQARLELIEATKRVFPRLLKTLSRNVFPVYARLAENGQLAKDRQRFDKALWSDNLPHLLDHVMAEELKDSILKWAVQFNARADWLILGALRSVNRWHQFPEKRHALAWDTLHERSEPVAPSKPFEFRYRAWDARMQAWGDYRAGLFRELKKHLEDYERELRQLAETQGLVRVSRKSSQANLEWFALYQFAGQSSVRIADSATCSGGGLAESTVLKGVKAAAKRIGWNRLRGTRARPLPEN